MRRDAVAIVVRVTGESDIEAVLERDERLHRIRGGRVHADPSVPVAGHEAERGIHRIIGDGELEPVVLRDARPIMHTRAPQRVDAHAQPGAADDLEVKYRPEVRHIVAEEIVAVGGRCGQRLGERHALDSLQPGSEQLVRACLHRLGDVGIRRSAVGRVVLEATVLGRVVRGGDDDAIRQATFAPGVVGEDRVRDRRRRGVLIALCEHHLHAIGGQYLERAHARRLRQGMRIDAQEERPVGRACACAARRSPA